MSLDHILRKVPLAFLTNRIKHHSSYKDDRRSDTEMDLTLTFFSYSVNRQIPVVISDRPLHNAVDFCNNFSLFRF